MHRLGGEGGSFAQLRALFARPEVAPRSTQRSSHLGSAAFAPLQTHASQTCALLEGRRSVRAPPPLPPLDGLLDDGQLYAQPPLSLPCILDRLRQPGMSARCASVTTRDCGVEAWRDCARVGVGSASPLHRVVRLTPAIPAHSNRSGWNDWGQLGRGGMIEFPMVAMHNHWQNYENISSAVNP